MKSLKIVNFLILVGLLISCTKEELTPRRNPRLSIAFIQEIDQEGVQFAANVYDLGTEEIVEYGFAYNERITPRIGDGEVVSRTGQPGEFFELKATHSMVTGKKYLVSAFIKTTSGITYSGVVQFESKGSAGFQFGSIQGPDVLYFGDTITVRGNGFSKVSSNYTVRVQGESARVIEVSEKQFRFILPKLFDFTAEQLANNTMEFYFKIAGKELTVTESVKFREPIFDNPAVQFVNYVDTIRISGDFMESTGVGLYLKTGDENYSSLRVISHDRNKITFLPEYYALEKRPKLVVKVRGREYELANIFEINPTDFVPNQEFSLGYGNVISAKATNLNPYNLNYNRLVSADIRGSFELVSIEGDVISFRLYNQPIVKRQIEVRFENFGETLSTKTVKINLTDPALPVFSGDQEIYFHPGFGVTSGNSGYYFSNRNLYKIDKEQRTFRFIRDIPYSNQQYWASIFSIAAPDGLIYNGSYDPGNPFNGMDFSMYDPATDQISILPKIPSLASNPKAVYMIGKYLYYEGGYYILPGVGYQDVPERYRFDFSKNIWELIDSNSTTFTLLYPKDPVFIHKGVLYRITIDTEFENRLLQQFNQGTEKWDTIKKIVNPFNFQGNEVFIIDGHAYFLMPSGILRLNLSTWEEKVFALSLGGFTPRYSFQLDGNFYVLNGNRGHTYEFDPEFFPK